MVVIIPVLLIIDWRLFLLLAIAAIFQLLIDRVIYKKNIGYGLIQQQRDARYWAVRDAVEDNFFDLKCLAVNRQMINLMNKKRKETLELDYYREKDNNRLRTLNSLLDDIIFLIVKVFVAIKVFNGEISLGTFTVLIAYVENIRSFMLQLVASWS